MIPIVDIGSYVRVTGDAGGGEAAAEGKHPSVVGEIPGVKETARQLHDSICEHGFCFLTNHGVPQSVVSIVRVMAGKMGHSFHELGHGGGSRD